MAAIVSEMWVILTVDLHGFQGWKCKSLYSLNSPQQLLGVILVQLRSGEQRPR